MHVNIIVVLPTLCLSHQQLSHYDKPLSQEPHLQIKLLKTERSLSFNGENEHLYSQTTNVYSTL